MYGNQEQTEISEVMQRKVAEIFDLGYEAGQAETLLEDCQWDIGLQALELTDYVYKRLHHERNQPQRGVA